VNKYANKVETSLKLFQAVSVFWFSFISECATGFKCSPERTRRQWRKGHLERYREILLI